MFIVQKLEWKSGGLGRMYSFGAKSPKTIGKQGKKLAKKGSKLQMLQPE